MSIPPVFRSVCSTCTGTRLAVGSFGQALGGHAIPGVSWIGSLSDSISGYTSCDPIGDPGSADSSVSTSTGKNPNGGAGADAEIESELDGVSSNLDITGTTSVNALFYVDGLNGSAFTTSSGFNYSAVPEPGSWLPLSGGVAVLWGRFAKT